jgi:hypothetical protein
VYKSVFVLISDIIKHFNRQFDLCLCCNVHSACLSFPVSVSQLDNSVVDLSKIRQAQNEQQQELYDGMSAIGGPSFSTPDSCIVFCFRCYDVNVSVLSYKSFLF